MACSAFGSSTKGLLFSLVWSMLQKYEYSYTQTVLVYICEIILYLIAMNTTINNILMIQSAFKSIISSLLRIHAHARTHIVFTRKSPERLAPLTWTTGVRRASAEFGSQRRAKTGAFPQTSLAKMRFHSNLNYYHFGRVKSSKVSSRFLRYLYPLA